MRRFDVYSDDVLPTKFYCLPENLHQNLFLILENSYSQSWINNNNNKIIRCVCRIWRKSFYNPDFQLYKISMHAVICTIPRKFIQNTLFHAIPCTSMLKLNAIALVHTHSYFTRISEQNCFLFQ